jgi:hypothetical protein
MIDPFQRSTCSLNALIAINRTVFKRFKAPFRPPICMFAVYAMERETRRKPSAGGKLSGSCQVGKPHCEFLMH